MKIYALTGKSGTGKSYQATELCAKYEIRGLIDDGLFIYDSNILEGISAKKQATSVGAIKTALFTSDEHCYAVRRAIKAVKPEKLLIIGTSDRMADIIAERLDLEKISEYIHITDITTAEQREKAQKFRNENGMHVIPAPTLQVRKQFSGYFLDARKSFSKDSSIEKTIVRPTYSFLGDYIISDKVISDIVHHIAKNTPGVAEVLWDSFYNDESGCIVRAVVKMRQDASFKSSAEQMQEGISQAIKQMTSFNIKGIEVEIRAYK